MVFTYVRIASLCRNIEAIDLGKLKRQGMCLAVAGWPTAGIAISTASPTEITLMN